MFTSINQNQNTLFVSVPFRVQQNFTKEQLVLNSARTYLMLKHLELEKKEEKLRVN